MQKNIPESQIKEIQSRTNFQASLKCTWLWSSQSFVPDPMTQNSKPSHHLATSFWEAEVGSAPQRRKLESLAGGWIELEDRKPLVTRTRRAGGLLSSSSLWSLRHCPRVSLSTLPYFIITMMMIMEHLLNVYCMSGTELSDGDRSFLHVFYVCWSQLCSDIHF